MCIFSRTLLCLKLPFCFSSAHNCSIRFNGTALIRISEVLCHPNAMFVYIITPNKSGHLLVRHFLLGEKGVCSREVPLYDLDLCFYMG